MEKETGECGQSRQVRGRAVEAVTHDRVTNARQMNPYLVGPAGADANAKKRGGRELLDNLVFRKG